jgi:hypothetical protein
VARRTHPKRPGAREGAAEVAPTAPHATPQKSPPRKPSGPERFWDRRRVRIALVVCAVLSLAFHWAIAPWTLRSGLTLELRDVEGDIAIPVDLLQEEPPAPPEPTPPPAPPSATTDKPSDDGTSMRDAAPPPKKDAGPDGASPDSGARSTPGDAAPRDVEIADAEVLDSGRPGVEASEGGIGDGGVVPLADDAGGGIALAEAGAPRGAGGPRDPSAIIGAGGDVQPGEVLVTLLINVEVIRTHPAGPRLGKLVRAAPQWDDALKGTTVDPVRDADWVLISGPSLIRTERDAILVRYSVPDKIADEAIEAIKRRSHNGAGFDAGVPGVKATLGHADKHPRVFLRPQPHLIAVVPPDYANTAARMLVKAKISPHVRPGEAMRMTLKNPSRPIPQMPSRISELRVWIVPRMDGGADVHAEGQCADPAAAVLSSDEIKAFLTKYRGSLEGAFANVASHGLINAIEVSPDGDVVRLHADANKEQVDAVIGFVAAQLGVDLGPAPAPSGP